VSSIFESLQQILASLREIFVTHPILTFTAKPTVISGTQFGQTSAYARIGQPQYLSQERYDKIRTALLKHQVETMIARRLDSTYDTGVLCLGGKLTSGMGNDVIQLGHLSKWSALGVLA
jgi:hypothetical protein